MGTPEAPQATSRPQTGLSHQTSASKHPWVLPEHSTLPPNPLLPPPARLGTDPLLEGGTEMLQVPWKLLPKRAARETVISAPVGVRLRLQLGTHPWVPPPPLAHPRRWLSGAGSPHTNPGSGTVLRSEGTDGLCWLLLSRGAARRAAREERRPTPGRGDLDAPRDFLRPPAHGTFPWAEQQQPRNPPFLSRGNLNKHSPAREISASSPGEGEERVLCLPGSSTAFPELLLRQSWAGLILAMPPWGRNQQHPTDPTGKRRPRWAGSQRLRRTSVYAHLNIYATLYLPPLGERTQGECSPLMTRLIRSLKPKVVPYAWWSPSLEGWEAAGSPCAAGGATSGLGGSSAVPASSLPFLNTSLSSAGVASAPALVFITGF